MRWQRETQLARCASALVMHTNHRRKNKFRAKHHNQLPWLLAYSFKPYKRLRSSARRARDRHLAAHGRFDDMLTRDWRSIFWDYW